MLLTQLQVVTSFGDSQAHKRGKTAPAKYWGSNNFVILILIFAGKTNARLAQSPQMDARDYHGNFLK